MVFKNSKSKIGSKSTSINNSCGWEAHNHVTVIFSLRASYS